MKHSCSIKIFSIILIFLLVINTMSSSVSADDFSTGGAYEKAWVIADIEGEPVSYWLKLIIYNNKWNISAADACRVGGFETYDQRDDKVLFYRHYLDTELCPEYSDFLFSVSFSDNAVITVDGTKYYDFNSIMNTLRTRVSYDPFREVVMFDCCDMFQDEIIGICNYLILGTNNSIDLSDRNPFFQALKDAGAGIWDFFNGGDSDEKTVLKAIISTPPYEDPSMTRCFHAEPRDIDLIGMFCDMEEAVFDEPKVTTRNGHKQYINLWARTGHGGYLLGDTTTEPRLLETARKYYKGLSTEDFGDFYDAYVISLENLYSVSGDSNGLISDEDAPKLDLIKNLACVPWNAYKDFYEVQSWNNAYMCGLEMTFNSDDYSDACAPSLRETAQLFAAEYNANDTTAFGLEVMDELMNMGQEACIDYVKARLVTPYMAFVFALDELFGFSESVSKEHQVSFVSQIQKQCKHRISTLNSVSEYDCYNAMAHKYITVFYLRAYMYGCSLLEDGETIEALANSPEANSFTELLNHPELNVRELSNDFYASEIDRVAPILARLISVKDEEYAAQIDNLIGDTTYDGDLLLGNICVTDYVDYDIDIMYYYRDARDFDRVKDELGVGSRFFFGEYEQDNNVEDGSEPIEWKVLEINDDTVKVQSVLILDAQPLKSEGPWYNSKLRHWCNNEFINDAFDQTEQPRLAYMQYTGKNVNSTASVYDCDFSSVDRVQLGISGKTVATDFAKSKGLAYEDSYWCTDYYYISGNISKGHKFIDKDGKTTCLDMSYTQNRSKLLGVRPSISISLDPERNVKDILYTNAQNGDLVVMGKDELDNNPSNGLEDIEWIVMGRSDNRLLLQTFYNINGIANQSYTDWGTSELKTWLNNDFYNERFTDLERSYIAKTEMIQSRGNIDTDYFFPQANTVRLLKFFSTSYIGVSYLRCSCPGIIYPITVCTVISAGEPETPYQPDYTYDKTVLSNNVGDYHIGDEVLIGNYEQDMISSDGKESIEWVIIAMEANKAMLLSKRALEYSNANWYRNNASGWLNNGFYNLAFNDEEKACITSVFLLSESRCNNYVDIDSPYRRALVSHYAYHQSLKESYDITITDVRNGYYVKNPFLITTGEFADVDTMNVSWWISGSSVNCVKSNGEYGTVNQGYVRPAIWLKLPTTYYVSTEEEFRDALFGHEGQTYTINITADFDLTANYANAPILHGDINFNGHTLTVRRYSASDTFVFGNSDSAAVNLNGEDCPGATIVLTQPFVNFTIGAAESQINSVEIEVDGTPGITPAQVLKSSLAMEDRIGVNFFLDLPDEFLEDEGAYIQINELQYSIPSKDSRGRYPFRYYIAAAQQRDDIVLTAHLSDGTVYPLLDKAGEDVTSTGYVYSGINYTAEARNGGAAATLLDMLDRLNDFGKYAQVYFDYYPELGEYTDRAGDIDNVTLEALNRYAPVITATANCGIRRSGSTLMLESATTVTHNFIIDRGTVDDYIFMVDGKVITTESTGDITLKLVEGKYRISIGNIVAAHLQDSYEVVVTDKTGNELIRISNYSALSYAQVVISHYGETPADETNAKLVNMLKSLYLYNRAAMVWFQVEEEEVPAPSTLEAEEESVIADEEPVAEEEAIAEPVIEEPVEEEITEETEETEESASEEPITEEPIAEELVTEEPTIELQTEE